jgi:hypothetical protein
MVMVVAGEMGSTASVEPLKDGFRFVSLRVRVRQSPLPLVSTQPHKEASSSPLTLVHSPSTVNEYRNTAHRPFNVEIGVTLYRSTSTQANLSTTEHRPARQGFTATAAPVWPIAPRCADTTRLALCLLVGNVFFRFSSLPILQVPGNRGGSICPNALHKCELLVVS